MIIFLERLQATENSERIRGEKADLQKLQGMFLARGQKFYQWKKKGQRTYFLLVKTSLTNKDYPFIGSR